MESMSSSSSKPQRIYDVFISFRGADTRSNFVSHLFAALSNAEINVFRDDDQLRRGTGVGSGLLRAIEGSEISLVVFSENYAGSSWCLNELVHIMECHRINGQHVIPVFYRVDPRNIRRQKGAFGKALEDSATKISSYIERLDVLSKWRTALAQAANLPGWDSSTVRYEDELVKLIVEDVVSSSKPTRIQNVFINFRGADIRKSFFSHLHVALSTAKINAVVDYQLRKGKEVGPELLRAIEGSQISLVIFSEYYAEASWCLDELVHIMECRSTYGQLVIPIFYHVDPSIIRHQAGNFGKALEATAENRCSDREMQETMLSRWRSALTQAANLFGWDLSTVRYEDELVKRIVEDIVSSSKPQRIHDVFINLRGEDTRKNFVPHLFTALSTAKINAFIYHQLRKGKELRPELLRAIEGSRISLVIFSENFAESSCCLDELVHIMECHRTKGQHVIHIFYHVESSIIRHQKGDFGKALEATAENRCSDREMQETMLSRWRSALTQAANLSGWDSSSVGYEDELVKLIVADVVSSSKPQRIQNMFISFRAEDTRKSFVCHLDAALSTAKINASVDYQLRKGKEMGPELLQAIEGSQISLVIFSENYAGSSWCLKELVQIMECHRTKGQHVIPIFYHVDPSIIRHQKGGFGKALEATARRISSYEERPDVLSKWRTALTQAANLSGWDSSTVRNEAELVKLIVEDVLKTLDETSLSKS